jgi:hypothetical protein
MKDGTEMDMLTVNPHALIHLAFSRGGGFHDLMIRAMLVRPPTPDEPWHLILYSDEVTPGNQLSHANLRKVWVVYFSWVEFGMEILCREEAWICVFVRRSDDISNVSAGMSQIFGKLLKLFFSGTHKPATSGITLDSVNGAQFRLFYKLGMIVQDGDAHTKILCCKGDGGTKMCVLCSNLYSEKSGIIDEDGTDHLTCEIVHEADLHFASDSDIKGAVARLDAYSRTDDVESFKIRQQAIGFRQEQHSLLLDAELGAIVYPATQYVHDWMHCIFVHGVFNTIVWLLLETLTAAGLHSIWANIEGYLKLYTWPARVANANLSDVFGAKRKTSSRKAKFLKCTASEGLSLYSVLAFYVQKILLPLGLAADACKAFLALADCIELLQASAVRGVAVANELRAAIACFLNLGKLQIGWRSHMHPKFHWLVHLPRMLSAHTCLVTCWVHERKHRMVKRYAQDICNTRIYERSVLAEVTCHWLADVKSDDAFAVEPGLIKPHKARQQLKRQLEDILACNLQLCMTSLDARFSRFGACRRGDAVLLRNGADKPDAGEVLAHTSCDGVLVTMVKSWSFVSFDPVAGAVEWDVSDSVLLVATEDILTTVVHTRCRRDVKRTLIPVLFRSAFT